MGLLGYDEKGIEERRKREGLHAKFHRLLIRGKARFNFLRAALWRKEAMATMNQLIEVERSSSRTLAAWEPHVVAGRKTSSIIPKYRRRGPVDSNAKNDVETRAFVAEKKKQRPVARRPTNRRFLWRSPKRPLETTTINAPPDRTNDEIFFPTNGVSLMTKIEVEGVDRATTPPVRRSPSERKWFRSHQAQLQNPGPTVTIVFSQKCRVRGSCLVSSKSVVYDERLGGWRFLDPGTSTVRLEFRLNGDSDDDACDLVIRDFETLPSTVDVKLDGAILVEAHESPSPRGGSSVIPLPPLARTTRHVLEIILTPDAAPWAYHLEEVSITAPEIERSLPAPDDLARLRAAADSSSLSSTPNDDDDDDDDARKSPVERRRDHERLVACYEEGHRNRKRDRRDAAARKPVAKK